MRSFPLPRFILLTALSVSVGVGYISVSQGKEALSCRSDQALESSEGRSSGESFAMGQQYEYGQGVPRDPVRAYQGYCDAAMQSDSAAQLNVGLMLLEGRGTKKDLDKGMYWLNRSASQNNHDAELALGILLVDSDAQNSAKLFSRSAAGGNLYANHRLAELYYYGIGVNQNYAKAQELSALGAEAGFEKSKELLTRIRIKQESLPQNFNSTPLDSVIANTENAEVGAANSNAEVVIIPPSEQKPGFFQEVLNHLPSFKMRNTDEEADRVEVEDSSPMMNVTPSSVSTVESKEVVIGEAIDVVPSVSVVEPSLQSNVNERNSFEDQLVVAASEELEALEQEVNEQSRSTAQKLNDGGSEEMVEPSVHVAEEPSANVAEVSNSLSTQDYYRGQDWINQQPDMRYAIQLVQASEVAGILKYISVHGLETNSYYIHAEQDGQSRYVLLYGDYPNNRTSKQVAKELPDAVQKNGYWIRTFSDLRKSYSIYP